jgi:hypothetical protein
VGTPQNQFQPGTYFYVQENIEVGGDGSSGGAWGDQIRPMEDDFNYGQATSYSYMKKAGLAIRYDPAVVTLIGGGSNQFAGPTGTLYNNITDRGGTGDGWDNDSDYAGSWTFDNNYGGIFGVTEDYGWCYNTYAYCLGGPQMLGLRGDQLQGDYDWQVMRVSLRAIGSSGDSSPIRTSTDENTMIFDADTANNLADAAYGDGTHVEYKSHGNPNMPAMNDDKMYGKGVKIGCSNHPTCDYNRVDSYICIQ